MKLKIALFTLLALCGLVICCLSTSLSRANRQLADAQDLIAVQHEMIEKLSELDAIHATINVEVNNRATFGKVTAGDVEVVADQVLRYTRKQLLHPDTLCKK